MNGKRTKRFPAELIPLALVGPIGAGAMLTVKDHENIWLSAILSVIAITVVMVWYRYGNERYDLDRAGDCSYYLGLCYTLGSLIYTLAYHFGSEGQSGEAGAVIPAFGVALSSTLGGVVARIYLQACAAQREEEEEELSTEPLTPERMRNLYGDQLALAAQAIARELRTTTGTFAQLNRAAFQQADQMARRGAEAGDRAAQKIDAAFLKTEQEATRLANAAEHLNRVIAQNATMAANAAENIERSAKATEGTLEQYTSRLNDRVNEVNATLTRYNALVEQMVDAVKATEGALEGYTSRLNDRVNEVNATLTRYNAVMEQAIGAATGAKPKEDETLKREILRLPKPREGRSIGD